MTKAHFGLPLIQLDGISSLKYEESFGISDPPTISWGFLFFKYS